MDAVRLRKYYRSTGFGLNKLIYRWFVAEHDLRKFLHFGPYCGPITFLVSMLFIILVTCTLVSTSIATSNGKVLGVSRSETRKREPRKESVVGLRPAYKCIRKHLQQTDVFQRKTKKLLRKELLEVEIMKSKMTCLNKLLRPEAQSEWRQSRSPKLYHRVIDDASKPVPDRQVDVTER